MRNQRKEPQEIDEVERMRRVRREIEEECKTTAGFFDWLEKIEREPPLRRPKRRAHSKGTIRRRSTKRGA